MKSDNKYLFFRINDLAIPAIITVVLLLLDFSDEPADLSECCLEVHTGRETLTYNLDVDTTFSVTGNLGEMEISIENERARIAASPCPGQDWVREGWIRNAGDMAVCVPSGVFIIISAEDGSFSPDAVSY